jgi:hypothetical protein
MRSKQRLNVAHQATIERESSSALGEALSCRRSTGGAGVPGLRRLGAVRVGREPQFSLARRPQIADIGVSATPIFM